MVEYVECCVANECFVDELYDAKKTVSSDASQTRRCKRCGIGELSQGKLQAVILHALKYHVTCKYKRYHYVVACNEAARDGLLLRLFILPTWVIACLINASHHVRGRHQYTFIHHNRQKNHLQNLEARSIADDINISFGFIAWWIYTYISVPVESSTTISIIAESNVANRPLR